MCIRDSCGTEPSVGDAERRYSFRGYQAVACDRYAEHRHPHGGSITEFRARNVPTAGTDGKPEKIEAWRYDKMRDDTAMQMSVRIVLPCVVCPVLLSTVRLDSDAHHRGRATGHRRMAGLGDDTCSRLGRAIEQFNNNQSHHCCRITMYHIKRQSR